MERIRCFIAIELPGSVKRELAQLQGKLRSEAEGSVKWVDTGSIHLTLKFLGSVEVARLEGVTNAMTGAVRGIEPFRLKLERLGVFPGLSSPRVVWVGVSGELAKLQTLHRNIETRLIPLGFPAEERAFTPHLTLGRVRERISATERQELGQKIAITEFKTEADFEVTRLSLMRSQLTPQGAIHNQIFEAGL